MEKWWQNKWARDCWDDYIPIWEEKNTYKLHSLSQDKFQTDKWMKCKQGYDHILHNLFNNLSNTDTKVYKP